ncbi:sulfatase family protein [Rhodopirellula maiorica SM1]|uniref:Sulfatase family protein n=2 Tax=Novipirellula TaxID=2795426 RepID=M5RQ48_9BACT|nr:sulfatase family protein [Rhodopirellula maiorica SM1]
MVDDLGWNHISANQATMGTAKKIYQTPTLEKLAAGGLSFTHAYAQPNCAPTRAAMLSGQYPARVNNNVYVVNNLNRFGGGGIKKEAARFKGPEQSEDVAAAAITVAEALKQNGYATAHIGKFHVGGHRGDETMPENVGFDINLGGFSQGHQPTCFASKKNGEWKFKGVGLGHFDRYAAPYDDAYLTKRGLPDSLLATPKHISDALGDAMQDTLKTLAGGDKPFYLQFHTYAVHGPVRARPDLKQAAIDRVAGINKKMAEYVGFIAGVDENLARMLAAIEDPNGDGNHDDSIAANTLILFTSDNGGTHADNEPLRGEKGMLTEGGIRVPLIAYWPGVIPADSVTDHNVHSVDYYPTYLELAGKEWVPPTEEHPLDGESFASVLRNPNTQRPRSTIFYLFPGYMDKRAEPAVSAIAEINDRRYKLMYVYETESWELYCLSDDQGESKNLIQTRPEIASTISKQIDNWLTQRHSTWQPKYPIDKQTGKPAGPPQPL